MDRLMFIHCSLSIAAFALVQSCGCAQPCQLLLRVDDIMVPLLVQVSLKTISIVTSIVSIVMVLVAAATMMVKVGLMGGRGVSSGNWAPPDVHP